MRNFAKSVLLLLFIAVCFGCEDRDDHPVPSKLEINDFVWKGMNLYYLWQADVPDLADNKDDNEGEYFSFLDSYANPTDLFNHLRTDATTDRFSVIYSDYTVLEGVLAGTTLNNGLDHGLNYKPNSSTDLFGWVRYVLPNSDAAAKNVTRGMIFYAIDGTPLTVDNYRGLFAKTTFTINLADYNNGAITPNGQSITLTKTNISENPVYVRKVITEGTHNIGYLMYNGFYPNYDAQLNDAFGYFASQNVTDLVLDLRYNSGGAVTSATKLASMITGQFTGQLFAKLKWNAKVEAFSGASSYVFDGSVNSLHLNKVYVLTAKGTASASELVINCLKPYINVVQIGDVTTGKNVASVTLYDSPTFGKSNVNPSHKYAMQPIVSKVVNKNEFGDYPLGLVPTYEQKENFNALGVLGETDEPLFQKAISLILANGKLMPQVPVVNEPFTDAKAMNPLRTEMYIDPK
ncbi:peptidase S41 [Flavobacterium silvisoli]|uniref:Peptidase S41 n=1 Tax=Flavobacterium silvisoli TaxID=2529433 RepID=A0A4Q9YQM5_9FLAO|nr:S41 family peptidase [Flavobacterium silvisoli]TBX65774.1 peptidase S41 [Flavobacterium silvisoli]